MYYFYVILKPFFVDLVGFNYKSLLKIKIIYIDSWDKNFTSPIQHYEIIFEIQAHVHGRLILKDK